MDFKIGFGAVLKWSSFICDAPHVMRPGSQEIREKTRSGAMECAIQKSMCARRPPRASATMQQLQSVISDAWWRGGERRVTTEGLGETVFLGPGGV